MQLVHLSNDVIANLDLVFARQPSLDGLLNPGIILVIVGAPQHQALARRIIIVLRLQRVKLALQELNVAAETSRFHDRTDHFADLIVGETLASDRESYHLLPGRRVNQVLVDLEVVDCAEIGVESVFLRFILLMILFLNQVMKPVAPYEQGTQVSIDQFQVLFTDCLAVELVIEGVLIH